jgi:hypothetical protein
MVVVHDIVVFRSHIGTPPEPRGSSTYKLSVERCVFETLRS